MVSTCQCRRGRRFRFDPWVGRSPGEGNGNPLQYSHLGNSMDKGAGRATVHSVAKEWNITYQLNNNTQLNMVHRKEKILYQTRLSD